MPLQFISKVTKNVVTKIKQTDLFFNIKQVEIAETTTIGNERWTERKDFFTYIELNILRRAVKANPVANIDFIFTWKQGISLIAIHNNY